MRDFFISYTHADTKWADWVADTLTDASYTFYFQKRDFSAGGNFVLDMDKASKNSKRTIAILSNSYLKSVYTQAEWTAAFAKDPTGKARLLIPVRIERCEPAGLLRSRTYCDLVDLDEDDARYKLLCALKPRGKVHQASQFPAASGYFPGPPDSAPSQKDAVRQAAEELSAILETSKTTFVAQAHLRDDLKIRIYKRFKLRKRYQFEELFDLYYDKLNLEERRLHRIIRTYTESVLHKHNSLALDVLERQPRLARFLPSFVSLKTHLEFWLQKYQLIFLPTKSMCLLYIGVTERLGFPRSVEAELRHYIRFGTPAAKVNASPLSGKDEPQKRYPRESRD